MRRLELRGKGRLTPEQAEGIASAMAELFEGDIATQADVQAVSTDIQAVRAELRETELRLQAEATKAEILKWLFGMVGFQTLVIIGAVVALVRTAH